MYRFNVLKNVYAYHSECPSCLLDVEIENKPCFRGNL